KIMRFKEDGSIPPDNPFIDTPDALPEIYSYGHRVQEGLVCDPRSGKMYSTEFGELGGDELNLIRSGLNYGWPLATYSLEYNGSIISKSPFMKGMEPPIYHYAVAPSDLTFVYGDTYPRWNGNVFIGALASKMLYRIVMKNDTVIHDETLLKGIGRVRDVKYAPDKCLYIMTEDTGIIVRLISVSKL
ncbi:MAG: PQQ-dependent sugar dehydrogenase, partial [Ginsengibacter sp.]